MNTSITKTERSPETKSECWIACLLVMGERPKLLICEVGTLLTRACLLPGLWRERGLWENSTRDL